MQNTAYVLRISDCRSDVCSSDLVLIEYDSLLLMASLKFVGDLVVNTVRTCRFVDYTFPSDTSLMQISFPSNAHLLQELLTGRLFLSESLLALKALEPGGHFVLKLFDTFSYFTISLIYMLAQVRYCISLSKLLSTAHSPGLPRR